jgi:hypothetical protein
MLKVLPSRRCLLGMLLGLTPGAAAAQSLLDQGRGLLNQIPGQIPG